MNIKSPTPCTLTVSAKQPIFIVLFLRYFFFFLHRKLEGHWFQVVALLSLKTHKLLTVVEEVASSLLCTSTGPVTFAGVVQFMFVFFLFCWGGDRGRGMHCWKMEDGGVKEEKKDWIKEKLCCVSKLLIKDEFLVSFSFLLMQSRSSDLSAMDVL